MKEYLPILVDKGIMFLVGLLAISIGYGWIERARFEGSQKLRYHMRWMGYALMVYSSLMFFVSAFGIHSKTFVVNWQKYSSEAGGYSIEFPGTPSEQTNKTRVSPDKDINVHFALLEIPKLQTVYASSYTALPIELKDLSEEDHILAKVSKLKNKLDPNSIEYHRLDKDSPSWKISGETKEMKMLMNYFIYKDKTYDVIVSFPKSNEIPEEATKFFDSFNCWQPQSH
jgi:hypothetical protein